MVTDPIADLLVRLQNASRVGKTNVSIPLSRIKRDIALVLHKEGYVAGVDTDTKSNTLQVVLKYRAGQPAIAGTKRVSKPSRRQYAGVRAIYPVKRGHGLVVLSTPKGVMTGTQARQESVGGEVLVEIW